MDREKHFTTDELARIKARVQADQTLEAPVTVLLIIDDRERLLAAYEDALLQICDLELGVDTATHALSVSARALETSKKALLVEKGILKHLMRLYGVTGQSTDPAIVKVRAEAWKYIDDNGLEGPVFRCGRSKEGV